MLPSPSPSIIKLRYNFFCKSFGPNERLYILLVYELSYVTPSLPSVDFVATWCGNICCTCALDDACVLTRNVGSIRSRALYDRKLSRLSWKTECQIESDDRLLLVLSCRISAACKKEYVRRARATILDATTRSGYVEANDGVQRPLLFSDTFSSSSPTVANFPAPSYGATIYQAGPRSKVSPRSASNWSKIVQ